MKKLVIPLLAVVMVVTIIFAGCVTAPTPEAPPPTETPPPVTPTPEPSPEAPPPEPAPAPTALPKPGEWTALTGLGNFMLAFTVNPDSTGIAEFYYCLTELECDGVWLSAELTVECIPIIPITGGQFTIERTVAHPFGDRWDLTVQGKFDQTGSRASGTWEISAEGTTCQEGTWETSPGSPPLALPKPGQWTASTEASEFEFTFTVSPNSREITVITYHFEEFGCGGFRVGGMVIVGGGPIPIHLLPSGAEFTVDTDEEVYWGDVDPETGKLISIHWHIVIQGKFDETATHASGTWEISAEGTTCQEGTWEASSP